MSNQVAETILQQLGGRRFLVMTGAKNLVGGSNRLTFQVPNAKCNGKRITGVWITLEPSDTYTVEAVYFDRRNVEHKIIDKREDVYCDQLQAVFTQLTGLDTHL
jgi:hypothetical protein